MSAAGRMCFDGPGIFHPATLVDLVNVEIAEDSAARPEVTVEMPDLIGELFRTRWCPASKGGSSSHPIGPQQSDFTNLPGFNSAMQFLPRLAMANHEADTHFE